MLEEMLKIFAEWSEVAQVTAVLILIWAIAFFAPIIIGMALHYFAVLVHGWPPTAWQEEEDGPETIKFPDQSPDEDGQSR